MTSLRLGYYSEASVVLIQAITPIHVGMGRGVGIVDMPVQRDALGFPTIFASSLKGPLRTSFNRLVDNKCTNIIFGPDDGRDEDYYAGAFNPLDAKLLLLPIRSLIGVYTMATSPIMLSKFMTYLEALTYVSSSEQSIKDLLKDLIKEANALGKDEILVSKDAKEKISLNISGKDTVILADEFRLSLKGSSTLGELAKWLKLEEGWRLIVVHDDLMVNSLLERGLLRSTRVALDVETKRVKEGALWTEEDIPPQTILYTVFFYSNPRTNTNTCKDLSSSNASEIKKLFENKILPNGCGYMIFGGHETIGRGIAKLMKVDRNV
ncbi:MAG: type III-B CRISPR module RAMP protein Cmr4 [Candidatus Nitrosocaldaceae archaeon]